MDFCFNCGGKTDPDWVFCRACGGVLEDAAVEEVAEPVSTSSGAPKVELISRGWDVVEVDTVELPADPLEEDVSPGPLPPGAIEVAAGDITVVEIAEDPEPAEAPAAPVDPWDHLRPHGEMPPLQRRVTISGRIGQVMVLLAAIAALAAAGIHFFLNTRLDAFADGSVSASAVDDIEMAGDISLAVLAGLIFLAAATLGVWMLRTRATSDFRPGKAGLVALLSMVAGVGVVAASFVVRKETVTEAIAANSLIVLGLGLVMTACLATVRTVERIDRKEPA
jgi:hypothetical protein